MQLHTKTTNKSNTITLSSSKLYAD